MTNIEIQILQKIILPALKAAENEINNLNSAYGSELVAEVSKNTKNAYDVLTVLIGRSIK